MSTYSLIKESDKHFIVVKDGVRRYNLQFKTAAWSCDCPARKTCKHLAMLPPEVQVKRYPRLAIQLAYSSIEHLLFPYKYTVVGSYRRGAADSKDIDIIILCDKGSFEDIKLSLKFTTGFVHISGGDTKIHGTINGIPIDIDRTDNPEWYAAHLLYRTGPAALNIRMRQLAKDKGFTLNEHVNAQTEEEIFQMVGLPFLEPEDRI